MKKTFYLTLLICMAMSCTTTNPLLEQFNTPHQTPPFDKIRTTDYLPAFRQAITTTRQEIEAIVHSTEQATFENTIAALDQSGEQLSGISSIFFNMASANTNEEIQKIAQEVSPLLTEFNSSIFMDSTLFKRVKTVYENKGTTDLTPEQNTLLEDTWKAFVNGGANLTGENRERFKAISVELSKSGLQFEDNLRAETNDYKLHITDTADLAGLPESAVEAAALTAREAGKEGWVFTLQAPSYIPFMTYADNRGLREALFKAYSSRCYRDNAYNNSGIIRQMTALRLEKARIMGYPTYADYVLTDRMAQSPAEVNTFLAQLLAASHPHALKDKQEVETFARTLGFEGELQRWDWGYYSNKLRMEKYALDNEMLKPYFKLENVIRGVFGLATTLYGVTFREVNNIPKYHPDVNTYEVYDRDSSFLAVLYADFFPRASKNSGAWMTDFRTQHVRNGVDIRPLVSIVMNFTKPTENKPSLLTFDEVNTFLHEFGHALHGMLSRTTYTGTSGTNVYRDFVELPSQLMQNWALEKEWLDQWAVHYETGEAIPQEYIDRIRNSANFQSGYTSDRQLSFGIVDMAWHTITAPVEEEVIDFERRALQPTEMFPPVAGTCFSAGFGHIFGGGYAAGYYSYKWAEVLDADAFSLFREKGIFDRETADAFRSNILEKGGTEHPMELYVRFRGQKPSTDALLERSGLK